MAGKVVDTTAQILLDNGPDLLKEEYWEDHPGPGKKPGYLKRVQAEAGPHKTNVDDPHKAGRALDIVLFANKPEEKKIADSLVQAFRNIRTKIKFIALKYNHKEWTQYGGVIDEPNDQEHTTHIHIEWAASSMDLTGFEDALKEEVSSIGKLIIDPKCFVPTPEWLQGWWEVSWRHESYYYYFAPKGLAYWTQTRPANTSVEISSGNDTGICLAYGNSASIRWVKTGSKEEFKQVDTDQAVGQWNGAKQMSGQWNGVEQISAKKLSGKTE